MAADQLRVRVLGGEPAQDRVVGGDRVDLVLLQQHQAVGPVVDRRPGSAATGRPRCAAIDVLPAAAQTFLSPRSRDAGRRRRLRHEHALAGVVVDGGEVDLLPAGAVDGHRVGDEVDRAVLHVRDALRRGDRDELDLVGARRRWPARWRARCRCRSRRSARTPGRGSRTGTCSGRRRRAAGRARRSAPSSSRPACARAPAASRSGRRLATGLPHECRAAGRRGRQHGRILHAVGPHRRGRGGGRTGGGRRRSATGEQRGDQQRGTDKGEAGRGFHRYSAIRRW